MKPRSLTLLTRLAPNSLNSLKPLSALAALAALLALTNTPAQAIGRLFHVGNDFRQQMWDTFID